MCLPLGPLGHIKPSIGGYLQSSHFAATTFDRKVGRKLLLISTMASQTTVGSFPALHLVPISLFGKVQASVEASLLQDMRRISNNSDACLNS